LPKLIDLVLLPHYAMLARYMLSSSSCVCLSVRLSFCLSQVGVLQRWLNLGSHKRYRMIVHGL